MALTSPRFQSSTTLRRVESGATLLENGSTGRAVHLVPFDRSFANAEAVSARYGIRIEFGSGESINLTPDQRPIFDKIDQECDWDLTAGEFHLLQGLGSRAPSSDILVFHVSSFADGNVLGCGGHAPDRPACTVTASALAWDTAHEVGHVLLGSQFNPVHIQDRRNLMHPISRSEASIPVLTLAQVSRIRASPCCHAARGGRLEPAVRGGGDRLRRRRSPRQRPGSPVPNRAV